MIKFFVSKNIVNLANSCTLTKIIWDDFGFKTSFNLYYVDENSKIIHIGKLKILQKNQEYGYTDIPNEFDRLSDNYCSLGQEQIYYEELYHLPENIRKEILNNLRDCVNNNKIKNAFRKENGFRYSLMRVLREHDIKHFRSILKNQAKPTPYKFTYAITNSQESHLVVNVIPNSTPPTNVQVIIGRNGVGKTRLFNKLTTSLMNIKQDENDKQEHFINHDEKLQFSNLITIAFSAFDSSRPLTKAELKNNPINYNYIGLKKSDNSGFRDFGNLNTEFVDSFQSCITGVRKERLKNAIEILNSDPIFLNLDIISLIDNYDRKELFRIYRLLSSGHKIVLFSIIKLVLLTDERTLVLIDEPETHLHPPLLSSFIKALSDLLINRNAIALIATHSPVVLQEVPRVCVSIMNRSGKEVKIDKPEIETYAENVGTLTHEIFKLEVMQSGFYKTLKDLIMDDNLTYEEILNEFKEQIGCEGRAIIRALEYNKD